MSGQATAAPEPGGDTRQRLLLTALQLYAREGLHAVSLRRISTEAGSRNSAAMHYHFSNKLGVIQALVEMIADELQAIASRRREHAAPPDSLREAFRSTLLPLALLPLEQPWGADAIRFMSIIVAENDPAVARVINPVFQPFWLQVDAGLSQLLPELPDEIRRLRLMFMTANVLHGFAAVAALAYTPLGDLSHFNHDELLGHLVDYLIGGLQAPAIPEFTLSTKETHQ